MGTNPARYGMESRGAHRRFGAFSTVIRNARIHHACQSPRTSPNVQQRTRVCEQRSPSTRAGMAKWRPDIDENTVEELLKEWQSDKNAAILSRMFDGRHASLSGPTKKIL